MMRLILALFLFSFPAFADGDCHVQQSLEENFQVLIDTPGEMNRSEIGDCVDAIQQGLFVGATPEEFDARMQRLAALARPHADKPGVRRLFLRLQGEWEARFFPLLLRQVLRASDGRAFGQLIGGGVGFASVATFAMPTGSFLAGVVAGGVPLLTTALGSGLGEAIGGFSERPTIPDSPFSYIGQRYEQLNLLNLLRTMENVDSNSAMAGAALGGMTQVVLRQVARPAATSVVRRVISRSPVIAGISAGVALGGYQLSRVYAESELENQFREYFMETRSALFQHRPEIEAVGSEEISSYIVATMRLAQFYDRDVQTALALYPLVANAEGEEGAYAEYFSDFSRTIADLPERRYPEYSGDLRYFANCNCMATMISHLDRGMIPRRADDLYLAAMADLSRLSASEAKEWIEHLSNRIRSRQGLISVYSSTGALIDGFRSARVRRIFTNGSIEP